MKKQNGLTPEQVKDQVRIMLEVLRSVRGFKIAHSIKSAVTQMSVAVREGKTDEAIKAGREALSASRNILAAFLRNAVIDRPDQKSYLTREIGIRRVEQCYHEDIVGHMESCRRAFEEAVLAESGADFTKRVAAYNAAIDALVGGDEEQKRRERLRIKRDSFKKKRKNATSEDSARTDELNRAAVAQQRELVIAARNKEADEILSFVS